MPSLLAPHSHLETASSNFESASLCLELASSYNQTSSYNDTSSYYHILREIMGRLVTFAKSPTKTDYFTPAIKELLCKTSEEEILNSFMTSASQELVKLLTLKEVSVEQLQATLIPIDVSKIKKRSSKLDTTKGTYLIVGTHDVRRAVLYVGSSSRLMYRLGDHHANIKAGLGHKAFDRHPYYRIIGQPRYTIAFYHLLDHEKLTVNMAENKVLMAAHETVTLSLFETLNDLVKAKKQQIASFLH